MQCGRRARRVTVFKVFIYICLMNSLYGIEAAGGSQYERAWPANISPIQNCRIFKLDQLRTTQLKPRMGLRISV